MIVGRHGIPDMWGAEIEASNPWTLACMHARLSAQSLHPKCGGIQAVLGYVVFRFRNEVAPEICWSIVYSDGSAISLTFWPPHVWH